jgi:hypothetical protein
MNFLSIEFLSGLLIGALAAFGTGFLKKAGETFFTAIYKKYFDDSQEFVEVGSSYEVSPSAEIQFAWVAEFKTYEFLNKGFRFHWIDDKKNGCFRKTSDGRRVYKEFLMSRAAVSN